MTLPANSLFPYWNPPRIENATGAILTYLQELPVAGPSGSYPKWVHTLSPAALEAKRVAENPVRAGVSKLVSYGDDPDAAVDNRNYRAGWITSTAEFVYQSVTNETGDVVWYISQGAAAYIKKNLL